MRVTPAFAQPETTGSASVGAGAKPTSRPRVVLLALTAEDPLAARLAAELEALGLAVSRSLIDPIIPIEDLVRQALSGGARGVVVADGRRTEFWVAEEGSDRIAMRQELEIENSPAMESVLSLRTVEFLRVSLGLASHVVTPPPIVPPPVVPKPAETDKRVGFALVSGVVASTGRLAPFATVGASLSIRIAGAIGIELRGLAQPVPQELAGRDGPVDTSIWLAGGGLLYAPQPGRRVGFEVGAGGMAAVVRGVGTATSPTKGRTDYAIGLAFYGRAAGRIRLSPSWSVRLDVLGGSTAARRPIVANNDEKENVAWGVGFVAAVGGIEVAF